MCHKCYFLATLLTTLLYAFLEYTLTTLFATLSTTLFGTTLWYTFPTLFPTFFVVTTFDYTLF